MPEYEIAWGRDKFRMQLPTGLPLKILRGTEMPGLTDLAGELRKGFADPFGRPPLKARMHENPTAVVVVGDYTRNHAYHKWLGYLLNEINKAGVPDSGITLYIGNGTHRNMTPEEISETYGREVVQRVNVVLHNADDAENMLKVGRTDRGTIFEVDKRVYNAELLVMTGGISYHYFAGYSGGRKAILPGCAARASIIKNHSLALDAKTMDFHKFVRPGILVGNPVNEDMEQGVSALKPDMCANVILNDAKQVAWVGVGDFAYVLRNGAKFLDAHNKLTMHEKADFAIVGSGGFPKDTTLFQAHKGLKHIEGVLKPGAKVIWCARCPEGEGHEKFQAFRSLSLAETRSRVQREVGLYSFCSLSLKKMANQYEIHLISELAPETAREWGFVPHSELNSAINAVLPDNPNDFQWVLAPDMSNKLAVYKPPPKEE